MRCRNIKLAEFAQATAKALLEFIQKLSGLKSPTEFFEVSSKHMQQHFERLTEQGKLLATLAQRVAMETAEPIKSGLVKGGPRSCDGVILRVEGEKGQTPG